MKLKQLALPLCIVGGGCSAALWLTVSKSNKLAFDVDAVQDRRPLWNKLAANYAAMLDKEENSMTMARWRQELQVVATCRFTMWQLCQESWWSIRVPRW